MLHLPHFFGLLSQYSLLPLYRKIIFLQQIASQILIINMPHITGTLKSWDGNTGVLTSDKAPTEGKDFTFEKSNIAPMKYSAPYEPKVGDKITGFTDKEEGKVDKVMEFI